MSLIGNYLKPEIGEERLYNINDFSCFRYFQASSDVGELQAFSRSEKKFISLYWFNHPNGIEHIGVEQNHLVKRIMEKQNLQ